MMHIYLSKIYQLQTQQSQVQPQIMKKKKKKKNCAPFADCVSEVNNVQVDNANYIDVVMPINNLL